MSEYLSWSETAWATQEERLAVETKGAKLVIGVPKERDMEENRILLNPAAVSVLVQNGHNILVETGAASWPVGRIESMQMQVQKLQRSLGNFSMRHHRCGAANSGGNWNDEGQPNVDQCPTAKNS